MRPVCCFRRPGHAVPRTPRRRPSGACARLAVPPRALTRFTRGASCGVDPVSCAAKRFSATSAASPPARWPVERGLAPLQRVSPARRGAPSGPDDSFRRCRRVGPRDCWRARSAAPRSAARQPPRARRRRTVTIGEIGQRAPGLHGRGPPVSSRTLNGSPAPSPQHPAVLAQEKGKTDGLADFRPLPRIDFLPSRCPGQNRADVTRRSR